MTCNKMEVDRFCQPCYRPEITPRGSFHTDQFFASARETLQELMGHMQQQLHQPVQCPGRVDNLIAELAAWQRSGQALGAAMGTGRHTELFPTVFHFEPDNLKMLVDVKGFQPSDLKLNVNEEVVEIIATREEVSTNNSFQSLNENCVGYMRKNITRRYILPQKLLKQCLHCSLSADGVLFISAPWQRC